MSLLFTLLSSEDSTIWIPYLFGILIAFVIYIFLVRWIFRVESIEYELKESRTTQLKQLRTEEELIVQNQKIIKLLNAQLELTALIANERDVNTENIKEITKNYGIKFHNK